MFLKTLCIVLLCTTAFAMRTKKSTFIKALRHALAKDIARKMFHQDAASDPAVASGFCDGKDSAQNYVDSSRCDGFIQCAHGIPYEKACARGTYFNPSTGSCDQLTCQQTNAATTTTTAPTTIVPTTGFNRAQCSSSAGSVSMSIELQQYSTETLIFGTVTGLTAGAHGFHIHEFGDLSNGCTSTGAHYNPLTSTHGLLTSSVRHVGDMGNIVANGTGIASIDLRSNGVPRILLDGDTSVFGRAIVVDAGLDSGPAGDDGSSSSVICCVIGRKTLGSFVTK